MADTLPIQTKAQRDAMAELVRRGELSSDQERQALVGIVAFDRAATGQNQPVPETGRPPAATGLTSGGREITRSPRSGNVTTPGDRQRQELALAATGSGIREGATNLLNFVAQPFRDEGEEEAAAARNLTQTAEDRVRLVEDARRVGIPEDEINRLIGVGKVTPDVALGGVAGGLRGRGARILGETAAATLGGAAEDGSVATAALSGAVGFGVGTLLEIPGTARDALLSPLRAVRREGTATNQAAKDALEVSNEFGLPLSIAEASEDVALLRSQSFVPATAPNKERFLVRRADRALDAWQETLQGLNPENVGTAELVTAVKDQFDDSVRELGNFASRRFRTQLSEAAELTGGQVDSTGRVVGGRREVPLNNFVFERASQLDADEAVPFVGISGRQADKGRNEIVEFLQDRDGRVTVGELQTLLSTLSEAAHGPGGAVKDRLTAKARLNARKQLTALLEDLDQYDGPAGPILKEARAQYAQDIARVKALENSAVASLTASIGVDNASELGPRLLEMPPEEITKFMNFAERANPAFANAARGRVLETLVGQHTKVSARGGANQLAPALDMRSLGNELTEIPAAKLRALLGTDLPTAEVRKAQAGIKTMMKIAQSPESFVGKGFLQQVENFAINAVSRSPEFVSRLIAGALSPVMLDKLLYTDKGLKTLVRLSQVGSTKGALSGAASGMAQLAIDSEQEVEAAIKQAQERRQQEAALRVGNSNAL